MNSPQPWPSFKTKAGRDFFQVTKAVAKLGMSQIPQKDLLETVHVRDQGITKKPKQELPPPPPPKKRQIHVDVETKKKFDAISTELLNWILKSKTAIQNTEMKDYKKSQETSGMKKKLKVKYTTNIPGSKIIHQADFTTGIEMCQSPEAFVKYM